MSPDGGYRRRLKVVRVEDVVRRPVGRGIEAVHLQRVRVRVRNNGIRDESALVKVGAKLSHVVWIEDLGRDRAAVRIANEGFAEVPCPLGSRGDSRQVDGSAIVHQVVIAAEEEQLVTDDPSAGGAAE